MSEKVLLEVLLTLNKKGSEEVIRRMVAENPREAVLAAARAYGRRAGGGWQQAAIAGETFYLAGGFEEAVPYLKAALEHNPEDSRSLSRLLTTLRRIGREEETDSVLRAFPGRRPENYVRKLSKLEGRKDAEAAADRARLLRKLGRYGEAADVLRNPAPEHAAMAAEGASLVGRPAEALSFARRALDAGADKGMARLMRHQTQLVEQCTKTHSDVSPDEAVAALKRQRLKQPLRVSQPLVLISQIQRSGGSLLSQLFDGHPQLLAHPYELKVGYPDKQYWPRDVGGVTADDLFFTHVDKWLETAAIYGLTKQTKKEWAEEESLPFLFPLDLFRSIFLSELNAFSPKLPARRILDAYFTAFFSSLLTEGAPDSVGARYVAAFAPRVGTHPTEAQRFFETYPDGRLIHVLRNPLAWYASARGHHRGYRDMQLAVGAWVDTTRGAARIKREFGERMAVIRYEDLVLSSEAVMGRLADWLGIEMEPSLLLPTFCGIPIRADSSYKDQAVKTGISTASVERYRNELADDEKRYIKEAVGEAYEDLSMFALA